MNRFDILKGKAPPPTPKPAYDFSKPYPGLNMSLTVDGKEFRGYVKNLTSHSSQLGPPIIRGTLEVLISQDNQLSEIEMLNKFVGREIQFFITGHPNLDKLDPPQRMYVEGFRINDEYRPITNFNGGDLLRSVTVELSGIIL